MALEVSVAAVAVAELAASVALLEDSSAVLMVVSSALGDSVELLDAVSAALLDVDSSTLLAVSTAPSVVDVVVTEEDVTVSVVRPVT